MRHCILLLFWGISMNLFAQTKRTLTIKVTDESGLPVPNATVITEEGESKNAENDRSGRVILNNQPATIREYLIKAFGFDSKIIKVDLKTSNRSLDVVLKKAVFDFIKDVNVGSRTTGKDNASTPIPVDVITSEQIQASPHTELSQILNSQLMYFNSNRQVIADGTDHVDPISLRGLGPDQVLILINGKRRHTSSLININNTFGRGSVSTDLNVIPLHSIKRIEILRDGAASQYGSDAIAGVINIVLYDEKNEGEGSNWIWKVTGQGGSFLTNANLTFQNNDKQRITDGEVRTLNLGVSKDFGDRKFLNLALMLSNRNPTDRSGMDTRPLLYSSEPTKFSNETDDSFLQRFFLLQKEDSVRAFANGLDRRNTRVGIAGMRVISLMANGNIGVGNSSNIYYSVQSSQKWGNATAFYRLPRQTSQNNPDVFANGFLPEINSRILDISTIIGFKGGVNSKFTYDISHTIGYNRFNFLIENSTNASITNDIQKSFDAGGINFRQHTSNMDLSWDVLDEANSSLQISAGGEHRFEQYGIQAGEEKSWSRQFPDNPAYQGNKTPGVQGFPGFKNVLVRNRNNWALYIDGEYGFLKDRKMLLQVAIRRENYSDFGKNLSYKVALRNFLIKRDDRLLNIRGSFSTGFRAPSLQQNWFNSESTQNIGGELLRVLTVNYDRGSAANDRIINGFGLNDLKPEIAQNYTLGAVGAINNLTFSVDGYWTVVKDRIIFSGVFPTSQPEVRRIVNDVTINSIQFFTNAIRTNNTGLDFSIKYEPNWWQFFKVGFTSIANLNRITVGDNIQTSDIISQNSALENLLFSNQERVRIESFVPRSKIMGGIELKVLNEDEEEKLRFNWQTIRFGEVAYGEIDVTRESNQVFAPKFVSDVAISYSFDKNIKLVIGASNVFDIYPDKQYINPRNNPKNYTDYTGALDNTSNGRIIYSRAATQFGANGRFAFIKLNCVFNN